MADRFPIILNTNTNQLQELPSGDTLDLTGSGLKTSGITTYTTSAQLNLGGGTNINTGTRGDILFYNSSNTIQKLSLGSSGKVLKSNGTDLVYGDSGQTANVYYVSTSGTDASGRGGSVDTAYKTIKYACTNITTPTATNPAIIFVKAGTYEESLLPIIVPPFTTIAGDSLRATIIKPASGLDSGGSIQNNRSTLFRMSNATVLQDLVMDGMGGYTPGSPAYKPENATIGGTYLALNAASVISTKSPYVYNCTSFGNGATGAVLDGALHSSGNRSMLFHTYTAVHSDGLGILLKANANAEMISTFTYYCTIGFACLGGSKIRSLNSSNAYGEYAVYSAGFDTGESANQGTVKGTMLTYSNVLTQDFTAGEQITGGTSSATAYVVNVQAEPKRMYIVQKSGTFQANETVTGGSSGATATLAAASVETNQSGRILVTTFSSSADAGDSLQFASTDGNAYQIQSVSSVTANSVAYHVLVFSTSRATPVPHNTTVNVRKEFSLIRLTGHDFLQVGTGGTDTTNWPNNPTQNPAQADQVITNETDPGRVYYTATDELGNFYVGDQFKVDQATGNVTLDASAFNLSGLESLRLGSVGGLIGAAVGEFSTDTTLSQNSDAKVPTQKAVKTYVDTLDDITPLTGLFTLAGISTVTGTTLFSKQLNVSGISTFHGNVNLLDGDRLRIGNSQDLQVYHDGNHSYIAENGGGDLKIQASAGNIFLQKDNGEEMIKATVDGPVELYFDDGKKIETTNTGAIVTGILTATDFSGANGGVADFPNGLTGTTGNFSGNVTIGGVLTYEDVINVDSIGIVTARQGVRLGVDGTSSANYISVGAGNDLKIWHQTSNNHSYISETGSGSLIVLADDFYVQDTSTNTMISAKEGAEVNLHFNGGTPKLSTTNTGASITGTLDVGAIDSTVAGADNMFTLETTSSGDPSIFFNAAGAGGHRIQYLRSSMTLNFTNGSSNRLQITAAGHTIPGTDSLYDLGLTGTRWRNVYADTLYGDGSNLTGIDTDLISDTSPQLGGDLDCNNKVVTLNDSTGAGNNRLKIGNAGDLQLFHTSNANYVSGEVDGKDLYVRSRRDLHLVCGNNSGGYRNVIYADNNGTARLYHPASGAVRLNTSTTGVSITGQAIATGNSAMYRAVESGGATVEIRCGGVEGYVGTSSNHKVSFITNGTRRWEISGAGHFIPYTNNTFDIGSTAVRCRNVYTNDLHLSNQGSTNSVDNTWGDFTIQEGESDLFLINNRSGKKYKFNLTEVN